jgi:hypothetical protein
MGAAVLWGAGSLAALLLIVVTYLATLLRGLANERVIGNAIVAMAAARRVQDVPPQRRLLRTIVETLANQERAAARMEAAVHDSMLPGGDVQSLEEITMALIGLQEPQAIFADFFAEHVGDSGSSGMLAAFAGRLIHAETKRVYADLENGRSVNLDKLLVLALDGRIAPVASAGLSVTAGVPGPHMPHLADADSDEVTDVVRELEDATRRQLRLATLLHGQAEAILRLRNARPGERLGEAIWSWLRPRMPREQEQPGEGGERMTILFRLHSLLVSPRRKMSRVNFGQEQLDELEIAFDTIGEIIANAVECLAVGEPMRALYLLCAVTVPVPSGLPGRIYNQNSLAQVRPLVVLGVRHRLAACRWTAMAMQRVTVPAGALDDGGGS